MNFGSNQRWARLAAVAVLVAALGLSACGRKGPLDLPPAAAVPAQQPLPGSSDVLGPDGRPVPVVAPSAPPSARNDPFILDGLLN